MRTNEAKRNVFIKSYSLLVAGIKICEACDPLLCNEDEEHSLHSKIVNSNVTLTLPITIIIKRLALKCQYFHRNVHDIREYMYLEYMKNLSGRMIFVCYFYCSESSTGHRRISSFRVTVDSPFELFRS
jgi:hypothetical protein